jgi:hypothetical protein
MKHRYLGSAASSLVALFLSSPANAALPSIDGKPVIQAACQNNAGQTIKLERLAKMLVISTGYLPDEVMTDPSRVIDELRGLTPPTGQEASQLSSYEGVRPLSGDSPTVAAAKAKRRAELEDLARTLRYGIQSLESYLDGDIGPTDADVGAKIANAPTGHKWLFVTGGWEIICDGKVEPPTTFVEDFRDGDKHPQFVIRGSIDDFGKNGKDWRKDVGAFGIGLTRSRSILDDGTQKTDKSLKVAGAIGLRVSSAEAQSPSWLYASYALNKDRVTPPPTLDPGKKQSDGDTNSLELGYAFDVSGTLPSSILNLHMTGSASFIRDFTQKSSIGKFQYRIRPGIYVPLGICDLGKYRQILAGVWTRCSVEIHAEGVHIFKGGDAVFKAVDQYLAAGGMAKIVAFAPTSKKEDGIVGSLSYRHLAVSSNSLEDIERWDASLGYRLWIKNGPGFDVGFTWNRGTNDKSLEEEDILKFGIGVIF